MTDDPTVRDVIEGNVEPDIGHYVHLAEAERHALRIREVAHDDPEVRDRVERAVYQLTLAAEKAGLYVDD